jgi:hypothetical protein
MMAMGLNALVAAYLVSFFGSVGFNVVGASELRLRAGRMQSVQDSDPLFDKALGKVTKILTYKLADMKAKLLEDTTQADFCKEQLKEVKERLAAQKQVVEDKMKTMEDARHAKGKFPEGKVKEARHLAIDADMAVDIAQRGLERKLPKPPESFLSSGDSLRDLPAPAVGWSVSEQRQAQAVHALASTGGLFNGLHFAHQAKYSVQDDPTPTTPKPATDAMEEKLREEVYDLKEEMKVMKNLTKEYELLHDRCYANAAQQQPYAERVAARQAEVEGLNKAYKVLDETPRWQLS